MANTISGLNPQDLKPLTYYQAPKTPTFGQRMGSYMKSPAFIGAAAESLGTPIGDYKRGVYDMADPLYHLAGNNKTVVGETLSDAGVGIFQASAKSGNLLGMGIGGIFKGIGSGINALFGKGVDEEKLNKAKEGTNYLTGYNSRASSFADVRNINSVDNVQDAYTGGLFMKGWASRKNRELRDARNFGWEHAYSDLNNNLYTLENEQIGMGLRHYGAFGGPLDGAMDYSLMSDYLTMKNKQVDSKNVNFGAPAFNGFSFGGDLEAYGSDFPSSLVHVGAGGSHESNPYGGVKMGEDRNHVPNLVEEGEVIWEDYVFSNRINIDQTTKKVFHIGKKREMTYADLAKKLEQEITERPNDAISKASFKAQMQKLQEQQERQKNEMEAKRAKEAFEALPPEEQVAMMDRVAQQEAAMQQMAAEQPMSEQAAMQQPVPEEAMMQQQVPQEQMPVEGQMQAMGGNLFAGGGALDWVKRNHPNLGNKEAIAAAMETFIRKKQGKNVPGNVVYDNAFSHIYRGTGNYTNSGVRNRAFKYDTDTKEARKHYEELLQLGMPRQVAFGLAFPDVNTVYSKQPLIGRDFGRERVLTRARNKLYKELVLDEINKERAKDAKPTKAQDNNETYYNAGATTNLGEVVVTPSETTEPATNSSSTPQVAPQAEVVKPTEKQAASTVTTEEQKPVAPRPTAAPVRPLAVSGEVPQGLAFPEAPVQAPVVVTPPTVTPEGTEFVMNESELGEPTREKEEMPVEPVKTVGGWKVNGTEYPTFEEAKNASINDANRMTQNALNNLQIETPAVQSRAPINYTGIVPPASGVSVSPVEAEWARENPMIAAPSSEVPIASWIPEWIPEEQKREWSALTVPTATAETAARVAKKAKKDQSTNTTDRPKDDPLRYVGLLGPAVNLGLMAAGVGKPDYSRLDAAVAGLGAPQRASWMPIGNYLTYKPMDIWYEQNRMNANARATDRAILNNANTSGTKMAGLIANAYSNQLANANLYRQALEYNDAQRARTEEFNRGTNQFNSQAYNQNSMFNAKEANDYEQARARLGLAAARQRLDSDASWYNSLYGNVSNIFKGVGELGRDRTDKNWIEWLYGKGAIGAYGGKIKKKRKSGLTY